MRLTALPWAGRPGADRILAALGAPEDETRVVGGAVRDTLLGLPVADLDLATRHAPDEVVRRLEAAGVRAVPTGLAHGTVTAVASGTTIEVTTLRRDLATDGRRAVVEYTDDWREDASRRDFTLNALYAHALSGEVTDFFGGVGDLEAGRVRFIGDPLRRIDEDRLRILRFFRFHARFGRGPPDARGLDACTERAPAVASLSAERVRDELMKLLCVADPVPTLALMAERRILAAVLPELDGARLPDLSRLVGAEAAAGEAADPVRRLGALLPKRPETLEAVALRLRLSNAERRRLVMLARGSAPDGRADAATLAWRFGAESARDLLLLDAGPRDGPRLAAALAELRQWRKPQLPVSGRDLIELGAVPGPALGDLLSALEETWAASGFTLEREALLAQARSALGRGDGAEGRAPQ